MKAVFKNIIKYTALAALGTALALVAAGCSSEPPKKYILPASKSVILEPPQSGSPEDHSALENVGFVAGKLASREYYHVESESNVTAKAVITVEQNVVGSKDFSGGILISETISMGGSLAPSKALQRYFAEDEVLVRAPASDKSQDWNGLNTEWSDDAPEILNNSEYEAAYGLPSSEFSDFVINAETVLSAGELQEKDGIYSLTLTLDPDSAPAYYVNQMVTMGGLAEPPAFSKLVMTIEFDSSWTVSSVRTEEEYTSKKRVPVLGNIEASCAGGSTITYSYDKADVDISAYEEYFQNYEKSAE